MAQQQKKPWWRRLHDALEARAAVRAMAGQKQPWWWRLHHALEARAAVRAMAGQKKPWWRRLHDATCPGYRNVKLFQQVCPVCRGGQQRRGMA
ncbi:hypothetical protein HRbin24_01072 [bacterium HR24]|nr:hypothetical protein HRbin24_01072 [bacterium HR24]